MLLNVQFTTRITISLRESKRMVSNETSREKGRAIGFPHIDSSVH
jgi:hypothetical protein